MLMIVSKIVLNFSEVKSCVNCKKFMFLLDCINYKVRYFIISNNSAWKSSPCLLKPICFSVFQEHLQTISCVKNSTMLSILIKSIFLHRSNSKMLQWRFILSRFILCILLVIIFLFMLSKSSFCIHPTLWMFSDDCFSSFVIQKHQKYKGHGTQKH